MFVKGQTVGYSLSSGTPHGCMRPSTRKSPTLFVFYIVLGEHLRYFVFRSYHTVSFERASTFFFVQRNYILQRNDVAKKNAYFKNCYVVGSMHEKYYIIFITYIFHVSSSNKMAELSVYIVMTNAALHIGIDEKLEC